MDVEQASASIDALIKRRATQRSNANALEEMYAASTRRHREKLRRANQAEWYAFLSNMAESLRRRADEYDERARALLEDGRER